MSKKIALAQSINTLEGSIDLGPLDVERLEKICIAMKQANYAQVYFGDLFFTIEASDVALDDREVLWVEKDVQIAARSDAQLQAIRDTVIESGLKVGGVHFLHSLPALGLPVESMAPLHEKLLDMAQKVGIQRATTHAGWRMPGDQPYTAVTTDELYEQSLQGYRTLCDLAAPRGIQIAIETACTAWPWLDEHPDRMLEFLKAVDRPNIGICLDSGHSHVVGLDVPQVVKTLGTHITETHFHDNYGGSHGTFHQCDLHNPIGIGTIDWRAVISAMNEVGYAGVITFEQPDFQINSTNCRLCTQQIKKK
ncbi:MAG: sugar phosphate isomerase/epimerase family protein, partial [Phycisphaeraceae bacterium JB051]